METTESLHQNKLFCPVRKKQVIQSDEEIVRQSLLQHLLGPFGCPLHHVLVEVSLSSLIHKKTPRRRLDIVCLFSRKDTILPLLVIECKAKRPKIGASSQIGGYNMFLKAPFQMLAWENECIINHLGKTIYEGSFDTMPSYKQLLLLISI